MHISERIVQEILHSSEPKNGHHTARGRTISAVALSHIERRPLLHTILNYSMAPFLLHYFNTPDGGGNKSYSENEMEGNRVQNAIKTLMIRILIITMM